MKIRRKQINTKVFITVVVFIVAIVPSMFASVLYYQSEKNAIAKKTIEYEKQLFEDMQGDFTELEEQLEKIQYEVTAQFVSSGMEKINSYDLKEGETEKISMFENFLQSIRRTSNGVNNIYVIDVKEKNEAYGSTYAFMKRRLLDREWLDDVYTSSSEWKVIPEHEVNYLISSVSDTYSESCFSFLTGLVNQDGDNKFEYVLQIDVDLEYLLSLIYNIQVNENDSLAIYYEDGRMAEEIDMSSGADQVLAEARTEDEAPTEETEVKSAGEFILTKTKIPEVNMYIYKISSPFEKIDEQYLYKRIVWLIFISVVVAAIAGVGITSSFMKPFERLIQGTMVSIEQGTELQPVVIQSRSSYIQTISEHFNSLIGRINELIQSTLRQETEKKDLQMKMLQAQISPHFLYNTLNSIKWMALIRKQPEIAEAITALVDLLEYCCKDTNALVPLKEELAFLRNYVSIQKMRNHDSDIEIVELVDDSVKELKIIKFSLQPGLENAFVHAFPENKKNARIEIKGYKENDRLILEISDNGIGFDVELASKNMTGIGISNVDDRIKLTFGEEYGQTIRSCIGEGTTVIIEQPIIEREY